MNKIELQRTLYIITAGLISLSVLLLIMVITLALKDIKDIALGAILVMVCLLAFHVGVIYRFLSPIRGIRSGKLVNKGLIIMLGVLLLFFGILIMDAAIASRDERPLISQIMIASVFSDILAAATAFGAVWLGRQMS